MSVADLSAPIELDFKSSRTDSNADAVSLRTFDSYSFERNILIPASPFRFTAPGIDKSLRLKIRSGDLVTLWAIDTKGEKQQLATGYIDETDTHIVADSVSYVLSGRDTLGQLVDNDAVDAQNRIVNTTNITLSNLLASLISNTRVPQQFSVPQIPNGTLLFQTNPGETKINTLQRYLEFMNCLVWTNPQGQVVIGKPNFSNNNQGKLTLSTTLPEVNNCIEARVKRNTNQAIRQIVTQLQSLNLVNPMPNTLNNQDDDMQAVAQAKVGRSVYRRFSYGQGEDVINQIQQVGNGNSNPNNIGYSYSRREIARENVKILDVEVVVRGHLNDNNKAYNIDQVYTVFIEEENVNTDMYVYACSYELTKAQGMITKLNLCKAANTLVADVGSVVKNG